MQGNGVCILHSQIWIDHQEARKGLEGAGELGFWGEGSYGGKRGNPESHRGSSLYRLSYSLDRKSGDHLSRKKLGGGVYEYSYLIPGSSYREDFEAIRKAPPMLDCDTA